MMAEKKTTIAVSPSTKDRLAAKASYGDSLEDVIIRLLDESESKNN